MQKSMQMVEKVRFKQVRKVYIVEHKVELVNEMGVFCCEQQQCEHRCSWDAWLHNTLQTPEMYFWCTPCSNLLSHCTHNVITGNIMYYCAITNAITSEAVSGSGKSTNYNSLE